MIGLIALTLIAIGGGIVPVRAQSDSAWMLGQINALRARYGAGPLAINAALTNSATAHSQYLANNVWSDPHVEANGSTPRSRTLAAGFSGPIGENVYGGGIATAAIAFTWWVNEPTHFRSLINTDFNVVGIGIASGPYGHFFTLDFGGDGGQNVAPVPANPPANVQSNAAASVPPAAPIPTRRPRPTDTPTITFTPTITYTPLPTNTPAPTDSPIPPTATAIILEVSPQAAIGDSAVIAVSPTGTPAPLRVAIIASAVPVSPISVTSTAVPGQSAAAYVSPITSTPINDTQATHATAGGNNNTFGMLIVAGIGLQGLIIAGFVVRQFKNR